MVELARALANTKGVHRVDLLTRQISSPEVDFSYGEPVEMLSCPSDGTGSCGAYIIRIPCGPRDKYVLNIVPPPPPPPPKHLHSNCGN